MLRILGRGHLVSTVTELIFVRAQCLKHFAIKALYALRNKQLDPVVVPRSVNCLYSTIGENAAPSQMSILTVGSNPGRGMRLNLPIAIVPLRRTDNGYWISSHRPLVRGLADVAHPRPGSFGVHGH